MTAQETLEAIIAELNTFVTAIEELINNGGDLTAQEVTDLLQPLKNRLEVLAGGGTDSPSPSE